MVLATFKETARISIPFFQSPTPVTAPINQSTGPTFIPTTPTLTITKAPVITPNPSLTAKTPFSQTNTIINNIKNVDTQNDRIIVQNDSYVALYQPKFNDFLISITSTPFTQLRQLAEQDFLDKLQLTKDQACKLDVKITTPYFANPDIAGEIFPLSFCQK